MKMEHTSPLKRDSQKYNVKL